MTGLSGGMGEFESGHAGKRPSRVRFQVLAFTVALAGLMFASFGTLLRKWRVPPMRATVAVSVVSLVILPIYGIAVGFDRSGDSLLVVTHSGRGFTRPATGSGLIDPASWHTRSTEWASAPSPVSLSRFPAVAGCPQPGMAHALRSQRPSPATALG